MKVMPSDSTTTRLSAFWKDRTLALVFLRHFDCPFARRQAAELRRGKGSLRKAGIDVVLVGSVTPEQAESFRHEFKVPFPIVCDSNPSSTV